MPSGTGPMRRNTPRSSAARCCPRPRIPCAELVVSRRNRPMEPRGPARLLIGLLLLTGAAAAILTLEARQTRHSEPFQHLVGGLGFGPALDLGDCPFGFDPRLDGACGEDHGPIPGGGCFCPRHAGSCLDYPPTGRFSERS